MSTEENSATPQPEAQPPTEPAAMAATTTNRKRPRLDMNTDARERKRGKSMFGLVLGTLNKAKNEDKERNASEAAKKRQMIEKKLQEKLKQETDTVRRAEETKKDKTTAARKEEDLQLKDSVYKLRRKRLPLLANFLITSDVIPESPDADDAPKDDAGDSKSGDAMDTDAADKPDAAKVLAQAQAPRQHPPPLYYLPAILLPSQKAFLEKRKKEVTEAAEKEWEAFAAERAAGITEIDQLRQKVAQESEELKKAEAALKAANKIASPPDFPDADKPAAGENGTDAKPDVRVDTAGDVQMDEPPPGSAMDVDEGAKSEERVADDEAKKDEVKKDEEEKERQQKAKAKEEQMSAQMRTDEDDAVEY
ncbi:uncharacterized protein SCHCODRAFT_02641882 [Schizophyllum commune H4-8]|uniref:Expressed protein n=1 Tax=Schizophyllum commune (strain H4-8 / FGSC 9210) TaxID=578458 RepID=D8QJ48_SCHCM|nr:uncharacterized protein SCHCODRAFT_02641882 [Schizophyllum commune H4-8]KAI5886487.1 hypothetical protein SCHCODRAFT_02641882 [Schizophyllum commune H4-8]